MRTVVVTLAMTLALANPTAVAADEITVWTARAIATVLTEIGGDFERVTGHRLIVSSDLPPAFLQRVNAGEPFDLLISGSSPVDEWIRDGRILAHTRTEIARSGIGVAVRAGARKPDISTIDAFKRTLLNAKSIAYLKVGSGVYLDALLERLGIRAAIASKVVRPDSDVVSELVASGQVELGLVVITQIVTTPGVDLAGPLPREIQSHVTFVAGVSAQSKMSKAANELIAFLTGPKARAVIKRQGMEPLPAETGTDANQVAAAPDVAPATIIKVPSAALGREQVATILLPSSYTQSGTRYPVLYLFHGGGQDHTAFATRSWFAALRSRNLIIVTPGVGDSWYVNSASDPTATYEDFIVKELVAYVDKHYRTIPSRDGRAVAGVSMGAWGAMLLGLKHSRLFSAIGALSAPFGISRQDPNMDMTSRTQQRFGAPGTPERRERDPGTLAAEIAPESLPLLFLACGSQDLFVRDNRAFVQRLAERKLPYEYREISPFGHSWEVWDVQIVEFIEILLERWAHRRPQ